MKKFTLFIFILIFTSCKNTEEQYLTIIKENNELLINQLDVNIYVLKNKSLENPKYFEDIYVNVNRLFNQIKKIKNKGDFELTMNNITNYAKKEKIPFEYKQIDSENIYLLQNSLLTNFVKFCDYIKIFKNSISSTHCGLLGSNKWIETNNYIKNDSINIDFESRLDLNNYDLIIDSIVDNNRKKSNYKSNRINKFWKVKYKSNYNNSIIYWKLYLKNYQSDAIMFEKGIDTINNLKKL
jgi:hypothetical protein